MCRCGADLFVVKQRYGLDGGLLCQVGLCRVAVYERCQAAVAHAQVVQSPREQELIVDACSASASEPSGGLPVNRKTLLMLALHEQMSQAVVSW